MQNNFYKSFLVFFLVFAPPIHSLEVGVHTSAGDAYTLEVSGEDSIDSLFESVKLSLGEKTDSDLLLNISASDESLCIKAYECSKAPPRNYNAPLTPNELKDLTYILKTMANCSLAKIAKEKSNLKKAGDRLDHLHPYKFLEPIFLHDELKVYLRNIQGRSWVWSEFLNGITGSLSKESAVDNLKIEYTQNFCNLLQIDINMVLPEIQSKNWSKFVNDLIANVPRNGDSNRYNM